MLCIFYLRTPIVFLTKHQLMLLMVYVLHAYALCILHTGVVCYQTNDSLVRGIHKRMVRYQK
jgi:hypothetical protein